MQIENIYTGYSSQAHNKFRNQIMAIIFENDTLVIERARHTHPGFDSAIKLAISSGDGVIVGHRVWKNACTGSDIFGRSHLGIYVQLDDDSLAELYWFGWRWSPSGERQVLGWWYGESEWDVAKIQQYGPVQTGAV